MIPEECWSPFQGGEKKQCVKYLIKKYGMKKAEAEKEFEEYRDKYINNKAFFQQCVYAESNRSIETSIQVREKVYGVTEEEVARMYESGMTYDEIMKETGRNQKWVRAALKKCGVPTRKKGKRPISAFDEHREYIIESLRNGMMQKDIAEALGLNRHSLNGYIIKTKLKEEL